MLSRHALIEFVILAGLLAAPAIGHLLSLDRATAQENRRLAEFPPLPKDESALKAFPGQLDLYLNDHFGFRSAFIEKVDMARFYVLGESTSPQVTRGKDGFLFFNSHTAAQPNSLILRTCSQDNAAADAEDLVRSASAIVARYATRGIAVSFIAVPNSARIYGDLLPDSTPRSLVSGCLSEEPDRYARAAEALARKDIVFLYPLTEFRRWRAEYDVYSRHFFHWTGETPWRTAGLLFERLGTRLPDGVPRVHSSQTSDLRGLLGGFHFNGDVYGPDPKTLNQTMCIKRDCMDPALYALTEKGFQVSVTHADHAPLGRVILVSDSFGGAITAGLARGYREVIHLYPVAPSEDLTVFYETTIPSFAPERVVFVYSDSDINANYRAITDKLGAARARQAAH